MIRGQRGNPIDPRRIESRWLAVVPTNTRWVAKVWEVEQRREGWAISTPWFTFVIARG